MIETYFSRISMIDRLRSGPLGLDLGDLATALQQQEYARDSIRGYLATRPIISDHLRGLTHTC